MRDTTVKCWGATSDGQLGDGTTTARLVPTTVKDLTGALGLDLGDYGGCARLSGGQVKCWGANNFGQLGNGQAGASQATPIDIPAFAGATQIQPGGLFTCAVFPSGIVKCVGYNGTGALGDGTLTDRATPFTVAGVSDARTLAVGWYHTCALRQGGGVACWGDNGNGQLNDGTETDRYVPGPVPNLTGVSSIAAGAYTTCVLKAGAASWWVRGQTNVPIAEPLAEILPGNSFTCARTTLGRVHGLGR